jgi:hypothetical protein
MGEFFRMYVFCTRNGIFLVNIKAETPVNPEISAFFPDGRGDWIRTSDHTPPRRVRYQTALRPDSWENEFLLCFRVSFNRELTSSLEIANKLT